ncbi:hypothetical protein DCAR_0624570 [Daucus carota subsp. sativus]|uniref:Uncharacterized protein n=1 Tax=Daucus carota subsp. sativus TaxID=79200 RepID=A0AAF0XBD0_DAUCS|nr:hypothetical protein DCAR_0624570 [Daucus carota subsp. sativus]
MFLKHGAVTFLKKSQNWYTISQKVPFSCFHGNPCSFGHFWLNIDTGGADEESDSSDSESNDVLDLSKILMDILFGVFCECAELNPDPIEKEEEHNWVFSADQVVTDGAEVDDSEWNGVLAPTSSIGYSNGDNDLARTALQVIFLSYVPVRGLRFEQSLWSRNLDYMVQNILLHFFMNAEG